MYNDQVEGKEYRFEISGDAVEGGYLTIDEKSGDVSVNKKIDREKHSSFRVSKCDIKDLFGHKIIKI